MVRYLKFTHPEIDGYVLAEPEATREQIGLDFVGDNCEVSHFQIEEIELPKEIFEALPMNT